MSNHKSNKLVGGLTLALILVIILCASVQATESFGNIDVSEKMFNVFEPNKNLITVESFGDQEPFENGKKPLGYWNDFKPPTQAYTGPPPGTTQSASFQMYQQAVNAATPSQSQLDNISNQMGGVSSSASSGMAQPSSKCFPDAASVNLGNRRSEMISPCAQNAPTFVASSLLPKVNLPGVPSWDVVDTKALATQDFLSPSQQVGTDTVASSLRNSSYDLRGTIPNPVTVVSPFLNSTIDPELTRKPLDCVQPGDNMYKC